MAQTLVLVNSGVASYADAEQIVLPYLAHFGVPHETVDLLHEPLPPDIAARQLIVAAQPGLDPRGRRLGPAGWRALRDAVAGGAGLVSFDPDLMAEEAPASPARRATSIAVAERPHPITARHAAGEELALAGPLAVPPLAPGEDAVLLTAGGAPLLAAGRRGRGRVARWATARWAQTKALGPLAGLDDVLWRSMAWAARRPFAMRSLAPLVAMRVDDVAGTGGRWGQTPLAWARAAARHGLRPWLGLFLYNLTDEAVAELRELVGRGDATAFPHAFGRPPRESRGEWHYAPDAMPPRSSVYDEFIYFDHERGRPWSDAEAARGLAAVEEWYASRGPLPISPYALAHWYEMGANVVPHIADRWGVEFIGKIQDADAPLADETPWLRLGPFRRFERAGSSMFDPARRGDRPVYYADFLTIAGRRLFNCVTEIRDDVGYEWAPDADVAASAARAIRQLRRALDSMALPVLFTHETDFIYKIPPDAWDAQLARIVRGIAHYEPIYVTLDAAVRYVRATRTSALARCDVDEAAGEVRLSLVGRADVPTHCRVFGAGDEELRGALVEVPPFEGEVTVRAPAA